MVPQSCPPPRWWLPVITVDRLDDESFTQAGWGSRRVSHPVSSHSTTYPLTATVDLTGGFQLTRMLLFPMATAETF